MNFSFSSDQQLLKNSARAFLDEHMKPATVRLLWDDPRGESEALWKEMGELGWLGLSLPEAHGGSGLGDRKSTRLNSSHGYISYAVFCLKKKKTKTPTTSSQVANTRAPL